MQNIIKYGRKLLICVLIISTLVACSKTSNVAKVPFDTDADHTLDSEVICSNTNYELSWDDDAKSVMLKGLETGKIWATVPYEYYLSGGMSANVNSGLNIMISNSQTLQWDTLNGYNEAYMNGRITSEKIKNGVKVTYYFDKFKISVPVEYVLRDDSLEISIDPNKISESDDYLVLAVSPVPFMCSTANTDNSYLFVPSGSGALMYAKETSEGDRLFSGEVYGEDGSRLLTTDPIDNEPLYLPVFGACDGNEALLSIIEEGEASAVIEAKTGNSRTGYSNVSANFYVREYDTFASGTQTLNFSDLSKVSEEISTQVIKIGYYPISGENANFVGMAKRYKKYLTDKGLMKKIDNSELTYGITFLGGTLSSTTFLGIPNTTTSVLTTFSQAQTIVEQLNEGSEMKPQVMLSGYGDNGILPGKIGGGFTFLKSYGGNKQRLSIENYCKENNIGLYTDFDIMRFSESGDGYSYLFDSAKSASLRTVELSPAKTPLRDFDKNIEYRLLKRSELKNAVEKLINNADKLSVSGIGLATLGNIAYSDYSDSKYYSKGNIAKDVSGFIKNIQKNKHTVATTAANSYAAAISDAVYDVPVNNGEYLTFDEVVPFYQIVFGGSKPLYSSALNCADNYKKHIMQSLSSGTNLSFGLINDYDFSNQKSQSEKLYAMVYENNKDFIIGTIHKYKSFYDLIKGASIADYEILENGVSKTIFDNGVQLYANHNSFEVDSPVGKLESYDVKWIKN